MSNIHLFAQVASLIPRDIVEKSAKEHKSNYRTKKFDTWHHLITMLFCHMGNCKSLREITQCLESTTGNLSHLGMKKAPSRNALSYMNVYLKSHTTRKWALSNLCAFLRVNLLVKINLWEWLNETYIAKLARPPDPQSMLL